MTVDEVQELEKQIELINIPVNKEAIIAGLKKRLEAIRIDKPIVEDKIDTKIIHKKDVGVAKSLPIDLVGFNIDGKTIIIPSSVKEEACQIYSSVISEPLSKELIKDYCSLYLHQQIGDIYEGSRLVMLQIENIINCALGTKDILNKIKKMPDQQMIWVWDYEKKSLIKVRPGVYMYGESVDKWPVAPSSPSDARMNFVKKLTLFFAYCVNNDLKEGFRNGSIDAKLFKEINNVKKLRDKISHRFALSSRETENKILDFNVSQSFMIIRSTLSNFLMNKPGWL